MYDCFGNKFSRYSSRACMSLHVFTQFISRVILTHLDGRDSWLADIMMRVKQNQGVSSKVKWLDPGELPHIFMQSYINLCSKALGPKIIQSSN